MNNLLVGALGALLLGWTATAHADGLAGGTKISAGSSDYQATLGDGYDVEKQLLRGHCLTGEPESQGTASATANFEQKISYDQLEKELGFGASGRARFGVVEASASAKFLSNSKSDAYSITATYVGTYEFKNLALVDPKISPQMQPIKDNDDKWEEACGHEYVQQVKLGAKIYFTIRIDFASEEEKKAFQSAFSIQGPLWGVSGDFKTASRQFSKRTSVTITTLQVGGEVDKISAVYGSPDNLVSCSLGEFDTCGKVLSSALEYATKDFPKQIAKETHTSKKGEGPVVIAYLTKPYSTAGIFPKHAPEVRKEVKRARFKLNQWLTEYYELWVYANRYGQAGARRLSSRQTSVIQDIKETIDQNLRKIAEAGQLCYDDPGLDCVDDTNALNPNGGSNALAKVDKKAFVIENESFAQFCDDGMSPSPASPPGLKETIANLLALAKELKPEAFLPPAPKVPIDECFIGGVVFHGVTRLNASGRHLSDLRPLMEFTQLESLDLADNQIRSLDAFQLPFVKSRGGFSRLRELNLHHNLIRELDPIVALPALEVLNLSNNRILSADPVAQLTKLTRVDLRNNRQDLKLTMSYPCVVLTADHGSSPVFAEVARTTEIKRFGHAAVRMSDGNVLITGGIAGAGSGNGAELFDNSQGEFYRITGMAEARQWHTSTPLRDGKVLILGGLRSATGELFDPITRSFMSLHWEMRNARAGHTATVLQDGRVLVTGGWTLGALGDTSLSAEIYDPSTGRFTALRTGLSVPRAAHTATLLRDGRVLLVGGTNDEGAANSADIFDPATGEIQPLGRRMQYGRGFHSATLLADGTVLVVGGIAGDKALASAELFDPTKQTFELLESELKTPRMGHAATLLGSGIVAITGGSSATERITQERTCVSCTASVELYDPSTRDFSLSNASMVVPRVFHTVTPMRTNQYLIVGGLGAGAPASAEILNYSAPN